MKKLGLSKTRRIRSAQDFDRIYQRQQRAGDRYLLVFAAGNDFGFSRFGVSVSKQHGNAVRRVRLKRLLREAFRLSQHTLPNGLDLILIPRRNSGARLEDFQRSLVWAAQKLAQTLGSDVDGEP